MSVKSIFAVNEELAYYIHFGYRWLLDTVQLQSSDLNIFLKELAVLQDNGMKIT